MLKTRSHSGDKQSQRDPLRAWVPNLTSCKTPAALAGRGDCRVIPSQVEERRVDFPILYHLQPGRSR
jgi:hypothetical protein